MANVVYFNDGVKLPCCPTLLESLYLSASGTCAGDCNANYTGFVAGDLSYNIVYTLPTASGTSGQVLTTDGNNNLSWTTVSGGGGGGTPAGIDGYIQYNNGGSFGGASILYWNDLNSRLGIGTATPNQTLEVAGTMRLTGSTGTPVSILGRDANGDISNVALGSNFLLSGGTLSLSGVTVSGYVPYTGATQNVNLGSFSLASSGVTTPYLQISTAGSSTPMQEGMLRWNDTDGTYEFLMKGGNITQPIGQALPVLVKHADNAGLQNGKVVYTVGSDGSNKLVRYAIATGETQSANVFGLMSESVSGGGKAFSTTFGYVKNINTSTLEEGKVVWLSDTELGGMTTTRPTQPNHGVQIGFCIKQHATQGVIFVSIQNGYELDELHNVLISSGITNQEMLFYNSALKVWQNKTAAAANLVSGSGTATQVAFWKSGSTNELQGNSNLYWDNVNTRLGVGTSTPSSTLDIAGALRVGVSNIFTISNNVISTPGATNAFIGIGGDRFLNITNGATTQTIINFDGTSRNVGIGIGSNLAGSARLHVAGSGITASGWTAQFHNSGGTSNSLMIRNDGNVAIGNNSPNARLQVHGTDTSDSNWTAQFHNSLGNSNSLMIRNDGNVGIGTTGTTARLVVRGTGTTSSSVSLSVQNSDGNALFRVFDNGVVNFGTQLNRGFWVNNDGSNLPDLAGASLRFSHSVSSQNQAGFVFRGANVLNATSGTQTNATFDQAFAPTSGAAAFNQILVSNSINQTGGASGTTRGLHVNPTLTSAFDWRSIEWSNSSGWGLYGAGTANNYLGGNLSVGTTGSTARLLIQSTGSSSTGTTLLLQDSGGTSIFNVRDSGLVNSISVISSGSSLNPFLGIFQFNCNALAQSNRWVIRTNTIEGNRGVGIGSTVSSSSIQGLSTANGTASSTLSLQPYGGSLVVGSSALNSSTAILEVNSTTQGFLSPRMTTAQRDAIVSPATGLELFNTSIGSKQVYNGTEWEILNGARQAITASSSTTSVVFRNGNIADIVLSSSTTLTFSNAAVGTYIVKITQGGSGFNLVSWPANVLWSGGIIPTLTTAVGKTDIFTFVFDSTNYYGSYALNY